MILGDMNDLKEYKLGDIAEIQTGPFGSQLHASDYVPVGIPCLMPTNIGSRLEFNKNEIAFIKDSDAKRLKRHLLHEGDIVYSRRGDVEKCAYVKKEQEGWFCGTGCLRIRLIDKTINPLCVAYYLSLPDVKSFIRNNAVGTTMLNLNSNILSSVSIKVPDIKIQNHIVYIINNIDNKLNLLQKQKLTLVKLAGTFFRQWLILNKKGKTKEILLKEIYSFQKGIEPGSKFYLEEPTFGAIRFIRVGDMHDNRVTVYINSEFAKGKLCTKKDLLISFDGTVGRVVFGVEGCYSSGIRKINSHNPIYDSLWLKHQIFISKEIQDEINSHATGTVILHSGNSIEYLSFNFPSDKKLIECSKYIEPLYNKIESNNSQIQTLQKLRDTLLPKLMCGEVRVSEL